jgi:hypothetical protein
MKIEVRRLTAPDEWKELCSATRGGKPVILTTWGEMLHKEHSPIRSQWYRIRMEGIPAFVSVHFVRHKIGVEHYVQSMRDDRGGDGTEDRNTPVLHVMDANAQAIMNMARKRLCSMSHKETKEVMIKIKSEMFNVDEELADIMFPQCCYRGFCPEENSKCHRYNS